MVIVTTLGDFSIKEDISLSFKPTTFWPSTSSKWCSVSRPFRDADESLTNPIISPFLNWNPTWPTLSLWRVIVLSNGLKKNSTNSVLPFYINTFLFSIGSNKKKSEFHQLLKKKF